jgi:cytoskeleton protein RodZ
MENDSHFKGGCHFALLWYTVAMPESKETIGQRLKKIRLSRKISIEEAAETTRIRVQYLQALEADNYSAMSSTAQGRGFLRSYAGFLGLDLEAAMTELREGNAGGAPAETSEPAAVAPTPVLPQTPSFPSLDAKPAPRPFWVRILRRSLPGSSEQPESAPEVTAPKNAGEPAVDSGSAPAPEEKPVSKKEDKKKALI